MPLRIKTIKAASLAVLETDVADWIDANVTEDIPKNPSTPRINNIVKDIKYDGTDLSAMIIYDKRGA